MQKRSLTIAGHRTSLAMEPEFWDGLAALADANGLSVPELVARIDHDHQQSNLTSALRVAVLRHFRDATA